MTMKKTKPSLLARHRRTLTALDAALNGLDTMRAAHDAVQAANGQLHERIAVLNDGLTEHKKAIDVARDQDDEDAATIILLREEIATLKERVSTLETCGHEARDAVQTLDVVWRTVLRHAPELTVHARLERLGPYHVLRGLDLLMAELRTTRARVDEYRELNTLLSLEPVNTAPAKIV
jgi:chromosome segregation ATPase